MSNHNDPGLSSLIPGILKSIDHTMATELSAEVTSANGKVLIDMIRRLVRWSLAEIEQHQTLYQARIAGEPPVAGAALPAPVGLYTTPTQSERLYFQEADALSAALRREVSRSQTDPAQRKALAAKLKQLIGAETAFHAALDPESVADISTAYQGGKSDKSRDTAPPAVTVTIDTLNAYLRRKFSAHPAITAANLQMLTGGMGKDTILFEVTGHPEYSGSLVMRKDLTELSIDVSAVDEFTLLQAVHAAGVAAPEPLWSEPDASQLGTRFIVVRRARGSVAISQDISDQTIRHHFADRLAAGLAAIHALELPAHDLFKAAAGKTLDESLRDQLGAWRAFWMRKRVEPSVKIETIFAWLEANIPSDAKIAPTLVHGDYGFHNLIMDQGEVTAILDWEFAHMGDPAEDVNYCRQFIERYVPFDYFLERYLAHGGKPYDATRDRYFTVWRNLRNAVASLGALHAFTIGTPGNIKMATAGLAYNPRFELEALRLIMGYLESGA